MPSLNKVILIGNLCSDPELKKTPSDVSVTSFAIGVQRKLKDKDGNYQSDFINIVAWRGTAEFITQNFKKGTPIVICGSIQTRSYNDQQGNKRYATEVIADEAGFCERKGSGRPPMPGDDDAPVHAAEPEEKKNTMPTMPSDANFTELAPGDDLPF